MIYLIYILYCIHIPLATVATFMLLTQKYPRVTNIGWLVSIWFVNIIGSLTFLFFRLRKSYSVESDSKMHRPHIFSHMLSSVKRTFSKEVQFFEKFGQELGFACYQEAYSLQIYDDDEFLDSLIYEIKRAEKMICIAQYIFSGKVADKVISCLVDAHKRGVQVYLLIDLFGSSLFRWNERTEFLNKLPFKVAIFSNTLVNGFGFVNNRCHSKVAYIDGKYAWIGSHNLRDETLVNNPIQDSYCHNLTIKVSGEIVMQVGTYFHDLWKRTTNEDIGRIATLHEEASMDMNYDSSVSPVLARVVFRNMKRYSMSLYELIVTAVNTAKYSCKIWTPYFLPPATVRMALIIAARRRVKIEILLPHKSDDFFVNQAMKIYIQEMIENNISVYKSEPIFDHSKVLIIDDYWALVGSSNFDFRSFLINYETNFEIIDKSIVEELNKKLILRKASAKLINEQKFGIWSRIVSNICGLISFLY